MTTPLMDLMSEQDGKLYTGFAKDLKIKRFNRI